MKDKGLASFLTMDIYFLFQILNFCLIPYILIKLGEIIPFFKRIGIVTICYALGIVLANLPFISLNEQASLILMELAVPLSLPLLLFNSNPRRWYKLGKTTLLSFFFCLLSVGISSSLAFLFFRSQLNDAWKISGMLIGVYTGGTPNLNAIGLSLGADSELFVIMNAGDLLFGGIWLVFLLSLAQKCYGLFLPKTRIEAKDWQGDQSLESFRWSSAALALGLSVLILGLALGISWLLFRKVEEVIVILAITSLGVLASLSPKVRALEGSYVLGNYLLMVFCLAIGSIVNLEKLLMSGGILLVYIGSVMLGAILIHALLAYYFQIDADTVIITSTAGLFGPAFIAPVSKALNNPFLIPLGIATALLGYGLANYYGIAWAYLLKQLPGATGIVINCLFT